MSDTKESMPAQPKTVQIPKVEVPANTLDAVLSEVRAMRADIGLVTTELNVVKGAVQNIQDWRGMVDEKLKTNSIRAKSDSEHDSQQDDKIEQLVKDVASVKSELASVKDNQNTAAAALVRIEEHVTGFFTNSKVKFVGRLIFVLAAGYAAAKGIKVLP